MRKIMVLILVLTIAVVFAGCGDKGDDQTTLNPLNTSYTPITSGNQSGNNTGATGATYILTTNQGKTVPALNTTRFTSDVAVNPVNPQASSTTNSYDNMTYNTTGGVITPPSATTTRTVPTTWQTLPSTTIPTSPVVTTTGKTTKAPTPTTTKPTTTQSEPQGVNVVVNDWGADTQGRVYAAIDAEGWGGKIKSNSQRVPVYIDGVEMEGGAMLQISSSTDGSGNQYVYLNLGDYEIDTDSSTIAFTIPEGFLENKTGTKYNYAYEFTF